MGVYSTSQFSGAFIGGLTGGTIYGTFGVSAVFDLCGVMALVWAIIAVTMQTPRFLSNYLLHIGRLPADEQQRLTAELGKIPGVHEVTIVEEEGTAYLKIDSKVVDHATLESYSRNSPDAVGASA